MNKTIKDSLEVLASGKWSNQYWVTEIGKAILEDVLTQEAEIAALRLQCQQLTASLNSAMCDVATFSAEMDGVMEEMSKAAANRGYTLVRQGGRLVLLKDEPAHSQQTEEETKSQTIASIREELSKLNKYLDEAQRACEQDERIAALEKKASDAEELLKTCIRMTANRVGSVEDLLSDAFVALKSGDANLRYTTSLKIAEYFKDNPRE